VEGGMTADDAIATVRAVRHPTAVETVEQERFVRSFRLERQAGDRS
jgi:protein-tyrosine phosphatase